jgi:phage baseplate assembly protein W
MADDKSFLGVGWSFPPRFNGETRALAMVAAERDIAESLQILLGTVPGERVMQPTYGCDLRRLVFEIINESTVTDLKDIVTRAIQYFEPRIILEDVTVDDTYFVEGRLLLNISYLIITTNTRANLVYPLYLNEGSSMAYQA